MNALTQATIVVGKAGRGVLLVATAEQTLPDLLRIAGEYYAQEGSWSAFAEAVAAAKGGQDNGL